MKAFAKQLYCKTRLVEVSETAHNYLTFDTAHNYLTFETAHNYLTFETAHNYLTFDTKIA